MAPSDYKVAIFSAEYGLRNDWPIYCGGLGILAGDWIKETADRGLPILGVGIAYHKGYFKQLIDKNGWQTEQDVDFTPEEHGLRLLPQGVKISISGRDVTVGAFEYLVKGNKSTIPLYLLTTNLLGNTEWDRGLTAKLYDNGTGHKDYYRTAQYRVLAAGVRLLQSLGYDIQTYHLNDGHGALVGLELLNQGLSSDKVKERIWFTTHTPVGAAFDYFDISEVISALPLEHERLLPYLVQNSGRSYFGTAEFAVALSRGVNTVSKRHAEVSSQMQQFRGINIIPITNGVHLPSWIHPAKREIYNISHPGILENPRMFIDSDSIDYGAFQKAHQSAQAELFELIKDSTGVQFEPGLLTIGFARRGVEYKRANLVLHDLKDLARIMNGKAQIFFAGKAPPDDNIAKELIQRVYLKCKELRECYGINAVFIPNYEIGVAETLVSGSDVWLNNPRRPQEASGTSGMKVAANGGVNLSVLDGWWYEAYNGKNGFAIAPDNHDNHYDTDSASIRKLLEHRLIPSFSDSTWQKLVLESLKLSAHFNAGRNLQELSVHAYGLSLEDLVRSYSIAA